MLKDRVREQVLDAASAINLLLQGLDTLGNEYEVFLEETIECLDGGGKLILFGNGGSAAESQHMAAEYVNRFNFDRRAMKAISLTTDTSVITSIANDYGYEFVFSRQLEALCEPADLAIGYSTSGSSANVLLGLKEAMRLGAKSWLWTGQNGCSDSTYEGKVLSFPSSSTPRIQELQTLFGHVVAAVVEEHLFA